MPPADALQFHARYEAKRGDLTGLFAAVATAFPIRRVLDSGSYIDVSSSFVFPIVTYVDSDRGARRFFADTEGVIALTASRKWYAESVEVVFHPADYTTEIGIPEGHADLLVSLYAGVITAACTRYLRPGGWLLVNDSHGDASMASGSAAWPSGMSA